MRNLPIWQFRPSVGEMAPVLPPPVRQRPTGWPRAWRGWQLFHNSNEVCSIWVHCGAEFDSSAQTPSRTHCASESHRRAGEFPGAAKRQRDPRGDADGSVTTVRCSRKVRPYKRTCVGYNNASQYAGGK